MTVWTNVTLPELNEWLSCRKMGMARDITPIEDGVEDSVFRVELMSTTVFLRLFERTEPDGPLGIVLHLAKCGLPTNAPLQDKAGNFIAPLCGKPAAIYPWINGSWIANPSMNQIEAIGNFLGKMSKPETLESCKGWSRVNPRGIDWFEKTAEKLLPVLPSQQATALSDEMSFQKAFWKATDRSQIAHGPIHADMFRNNVMFKPDGRLAAVIDWGFCASNMPLIYDLAIVANDWCLADGRHTLDPARLNALLKARESVTPLSPAEKKAWPVALRLAALRFYLSRQYDASFPRNEDGKVLDPSHFEKILSGHRAMDIQRQTSPKPHRMQRAQGNASQELLTI